MTINGILKIIGFSAFFKVQRVTNKGINEAFENGVKQRFQEILKYFLSLYYL